MRQIRKFTVFVLIFGYLLLGKCFATDKISVFVSIVPQIYIVQQIGKNLVDVQAMVAPGASPHSYEPKPRQMVDLFKTKIYFAVGVPFESAWLGKLAAANPEMKIVHTDRGIKKLTMAAHQHSGEAEEHHEGDEHYDEGEHGGGIEPENDPQDHEGVDPHIWLSPPLVKIQARAILIALQEIDPAHRSVYNANCQAFIEQIDQLDADLKRTFADRQGLQFMVFHPSWGYFAHAYGLKQVPIEFEGKTPKPAHLKTLIQNARERGIRVIFVQPQFSTKSADLVAREIGGQVVFADPLAAEWMANLREVAAKFKAALR